MHIGSGQFLLPDHKLAPKWAWPGVRDPISKFCDPLNISQTEKTTIIKFGKHIGRGQFLPPDHKLAPSIQVKLKIASKEDHDSGVDPWPHLKVNDSQVKVTMSINAHYQNMSYRRHGWSYDLQIRYTDGQFLPTNHTNWPLTVRATSQSSDPISKF